MTQCHGDKHNLGIPAVPALTLSTLSALRTDWGTDWAVLEHTQCSELVPHQVAHIISEPACPAVLPEGLKHVPAAHAQRVSMAPAAYFSLMLSLCSEA